MTDLSAWLNHWAIAGMDLLLGWTLRWSQDVALVVVAVVTSSVLTFVRLFTTDQRYLKTCSRDRKTLKALLGQAKRNKDKAAAGRYRATLGMIGIHSMRSEVKPLIVSLIPIILLATWAFARLAFVPPTPAGPVTVKAYFPVLSIGRTAHIVPQRGISCDQWLAEIVENIDDTGKVVSGVASWQIRAKGRREPYELRIRHDGTTVTKQLIVDGHHYAAQARRYDNDKIIAAQIDMKPFKPFGLIPGISRIYLAPWIVGYLVIAIPFVVILKRVSGIN